MPVNGAIRSLARGKEVPVGVRVLGRAFQWRSYPADGGSAIEYSIICQPPKHAKMLLLGNAIVTHDSQWYEESPTWGGSTYSVAVNYSDVGQIGLLRFDLHGATDHVLRFVAPYYRSCWLTGIWLGARGDIIQQDSGTGNNTAPTLAPGGYRCTAIHVARHHTSGENVYYDRESRLWSYRPSAVLVEKRNVTASDTYGQNLYNQKDAAILLRDSAET